MLIFILVLEPTQGSKKKNRFKASFMGFIVSFLTMFQIRVSGMSSLRSFFAVMIQLL